VAKKLTQKKLDTMFKVWVERQSVNFVAKKCKVSHTTIEKYMELQDWVGRLAAVQLKAQAKQDDNLANSLAENLKIVQFAKDKIVKLIKRGQITKKPAADLDKMIRLELLLRGEADSRPELVDNRLKDISTETLLIMQRKLKGR